MSAPRQDLSSPVANAQLTDELRKMLLTRYEDVYELSPDGLRYVKPASLSGVPVVKSGEGSAYWQTGWSSLDDYLAGEQREEDLKSRAANILKHDPNNSDAKKERKLRTDNVSKQRKIREVFGGTERAHPNQLVAKRHLPLIGLCEQEIMYHIGCKMTDLQTLANKNLLGMDPWDFYRWRISRALRERRRGLVLGTKKDSVRGVINSLDGENGSDPLFREAVMYSAKLQGRYASYGPKKNAGNRTYAQNGRVVRGPKQQRKLSARLGVPYRKPSPSSSLATEFIKQRKADQDRAKAERESARAERRAGFAAQSTYAGVNSYRAQKANGKAQNRNGGKESSGDGSGSETARNDSDSDQVNSSSSKF